MMRSPALKSEHGDLRAFRPPFFRRALGPFPLRPPIHGDGQHQDKTRQSVRLFDLTLGDGKTPGLEIGEQGLNTPAHAILENGVFKMGPSSMAMIHGSLYPFSWITPILVMMPVS